MTKKISLFAGNYRIVSYNFPQMSFPSFIVAIHLNYRNLLIHFCSSRTGTFPAVSQYLPLFMNRYGKSSSTKSSSSIAHGNTSLQTYRNVSHNLDSFPSSSTHYFTSEQNFRHHVLHHNFNILFFNHKSTNKRCKFSLYKP